MASDRFLPEAGVAIPLVVALFFGDDQNTLIYYTIRPLLCSTLPHMICLRIITDATFSATPYLHSTPLQGFRLTGA